MHFRLGEVECHQPGRQTVISRRQLSTLLATIDGRVLMVDDVERRDRSLLPSKGTVPISTIHGTHFQFTVSKPAKKILVIKAEITAYLS